MHCVCLYLPPFCRTKKNEAEWHEEIVGLNRDLVELYGSEAAEASLTLLIGDFNTQPRCLGAGPDFAPERDRALSALCRRWKLHLHNPSLHGDVPATLTLPLRKRTVQIRRGSTRHGPDVGRAIDLAYASPDLQPNDVIHNGGWNNNNIIDARFKG